MGAEDWQKERLNMIANNPQAFAGAQTDYANAQHLYNAGGAQQQNTQQLLDQAYADYQTHANMPFQQIDRAGNLLGMAIGNSGQSTSSGGGNQTLQQIMQAIIWHSSCTAPKALGGNMGFKPLNIIKNQFKWAKEHPVRHPAPGPVGAGASGCRPCLPVARRPGLGRSRWKRAALRYRRRCGDWGIARC